MKWPRRRRRGVVSVSRRELIRLQAAAIRAHELEARTRDLQARTHLLHAECRAHQLAELAGRPELPDSLLEDLPLTADGRLHEPAFTALVDAHVWAARERKLAAVLGSPDRSDRGAR